MNTNKPKFKLSEVVNYDNDSYQIFKPPKLIGETFFYQIAKYNEGKKQMENNSESLTVKENELKKL